MLDTATLNVLDDLTARTLYRAEVWQLPVLSHEEEQHALWLFYKLVGNLSSYRFRWKVK